MSDKLTGKSQGIYTGISYICIKFLSMPSHYGIP